MLFVVQIEDLQLCGDDGATDRPRNTTVGAYTVTYAIDDAVYVIAVFVGRIEEAGGDGSSYDFIRLRLEKPRVKCAGNFERGDGVLYLMDVAAILREQLTIERNYPLLKFIYALLAALQFCFECSAFHLRCIFRYYD